MNYSEANDILCDKDPLHGKGRFGWRTGRVQDRTTKLHWAERRYGRLLKDLLLSRTERALFDQDGSEMFRVGEESKIMLKNVLWNIYPGYIITRS